MAVLQLRSPLSPEERLEKRKLIVRDLIALLSLFAITLVLATLTYFLFRSFTLHRQELAQRWLARGRAAMAANHPEQAVLALRSALEYQPGERRTEIELASALAAAGHNQEAAAYFATLLDAEPGNGLINLELARLAVKQGNESQAIESYERALDGTWQGDGYLRRLAVRLELTRYLLNRHDYAHARTQLLIASGNAPDEPKVKLEIAGLMEQAQDPTSAFEVYRKLAQGRSERPETLDALEGAGRTAEAVGRYALVRQYLGRALNHPDFDKRPEVERQAIRNSFSDAGRLLALYPSAELSVRERVARILHNVQTARTHFMACTAGQVTAQPALAARWQQVPQNLSLPSLERDPQLEQQLMTLVYDTEKQATVTCGAPTGDDALLLKMAQAAVEWGQP
jgi:tetratricopeptide (TPR) repeat protein